MYRFDRKKNVVQTEKDAKRIFQRNFGMTYTWNYLVRRNILGWDLDQDIITKTVGRKTVINNYLKKQMNK
jgi:endonuclease-3